MKSYRELLAQRAQLDREIEVLRHAERTGVIEKIHAMMSEYLITPGELDERRDRRRGPRSPVAPKYLNPITGQTWSGRGKLPGWLAGKDREQYRLVPYAPMGASSSAVPGAQQALLLNGLPDVLMDNTGLKVFGADQWLQEKRHYQVDGEAGMV
ncbi:H-NS histone family protein [Paraburkholderia antibiotica]|uniref:H-NS histone family protein n=1 Tax=Paraburkholderia antibiotica TaxID=2728839 RepID=A0A7Y0FGX7_9BURK|nr:H-NS histone family protein [Paraburkholderia antibiotica]NML35494.1 H-NS histone family protein [Paraburkholderia antibiotica]